MKYSKLRGRIIEVYGTQKAFAVEMKMSVCTLCLKLSGKALWNQREIIKACQLLNIPLEEAHLYFFSARVGKHQLTDGKE